MITNFKLYEKLNDNGAPNIGDYVICSDHENNNHDNFFKNKIGKILNINYDKIYTHAITYDNIPDRLYDNIIKGKRTIGVKRNNIIYWSENKEELEQMLQANKFNL